MLRSLLSHRLYSAMLHAAIERRTRRTLSNLLTRLAALALLSSSARCRKAKWTLHFRFGALRRGLLALSSQPMRKGTGGCLIPLARGFSGLCAASRATSLSLIASRIARTRSLRRGVQVLCTLRFRPKAALHARAAALGRGVVKLRAAREGGRRFDAVRARVLKEALSGGLAAMRAASRDAWLGVWVTFARRSRLLRGFDAMVALQRGRRKGEPRCVLKESTGMARVDVCEQRGVIAQPGFAGITLTSWTASSMRTPSVPLRLSSPFAPYGLTPQQPSSSMLRRSTSCSRAFASPSKAWLFRTMDRLID